MESRKIFFLTTLGLALSVFGITALVHKVKKNIPIAMDTKGFPSLGAKTAPIEIVLVEDFQCKNCREFSRKILPKLQKQYVLEGRVRFTLVPVSFLAGSQSTANALLEVYYQSPHQFFQYLKDVLMHEGEIKESDLIRLAKRLSGIDLDKLQICMRNQCHHEELQKNLAWAQEMMGNGFRTPALYVNGAVGSTYSFEAIEYQINQILGKK